MNDFRNFLYGIHHGVVINRAKFYALHSAVLEKLIQTYKFVPYSIDLHKVTQFLTQLFNSLLPQNAKLPINYIVHSASGVKLLQFVRLSRDARNKKSFLIKCDCGSCGTTGQPKVEFVRATI